LKYVGGGWVNVVFAFAFYVVTCGLISLAALAGDTEYEIYYNLNIIVCAVMATGLFMAEFIVNFNKAAPIKQLLATMWTEDVLYFKYEIYVVGMGILFPLYILKWVFLLLMMEFAHLLVNTIMIYGIFGLQVCFPLGLTIYLSIRDSILNLRDKGEFRAILQDPDGFALLLKYSEYEFSSENLLCYQRLQKFKRLTQVADRQLFLKDFSLLFLGGAQSELEINISGDLVEEIQSKMKKGEFELAILEGVERAVISNIKDTFGRFRRTGEYQKYTKEKNIATEI
jgi:hypothetical protein